MPTEPCSLSHEGSQNVKIPRRFHTRGALSLKNLHHQRKDSGVWVAPVHWCTSPAPFPLHSWRHDRRLEYRSSLWSRSQAAVYRSVAKTASAAPGRSPHDLSRLPTRVAEMHTRKAAAGRGPAIRRAPDQPMNQAVERSLILGSIGSLARGLGAIRRKGSPLQISQVFPAVLIACNLCAALAYLCSGDRKRASPSFLSARDVDSSETGRRMMSIRAGRA
jgi:hypothetical protein